MNQQAPALEDRVLVELRRKPGQRSAELAELLGVERREVNRCLAYELVGKVQQGADYRWRPVDSARAAAAHPQSAGTTDIAKLCRYYLECIGQDMGEGVNALACSNGGEPDYAELARLPFANAGQDWFNAPGVGRILGKVRQERSRLVAWLGYPVRMRRHRLPQREGLILEPVLLWRIELGEQGGDPPHIEDDAPLANAKFLRSVAMGDGLQLAEETARLADELGLNVAVADLPDADEIVERLARIRPDWDWREVPDPADCRGGTPLAEITVAGIYNRAIVLPGERSPFTQGLEAELKTLSGVDETALRGTALGRWMSGMVSPEDQEVDREPLIEVLPMNTEQRAAVRTALSAPHTVVTGPPGTGKSQVVTNLLVNAAWRGMKVLFASKNNKAVDVVEAGQRLGKTTCTPPIGHHGTPGQARGLSHAVAGRQSGRRRATELR